MMVFQPVERVLTLTKEHAAVRQVSLAINALANGDYDAAITLAGAAENMLPGDPAIEISSQLLNHQPAIDELGKAFWIEVVNLERNWLKHLSDHVGEALVLNLDNTPIYIYRAMRKLPATAITAEMLEFEDWYRSRVEDERRRRLSADASK